jgi:hypothetical protein
MRYDPDRAARVFVEAARMGRHLPPAWDGDRISTPTFTPEGAYLGRVLPGRGFALATDLHAFGITRPIPGVYERSAVERLRERWDQWLPRIEPQDHARAYTHRGVQRLLLDTDRAAIELLSSSPAVLAAKSLAAAITTYDGIINTRANGKANDNVMAKASVTSVAQAFTTLFRATGNPAAGTYSNIPGGAVHTRASVGAWAGLRNPGGSDLKYLLTIGYGSTQAIDWGILVDLLVAAANILATISTAQTVNTTAQTRQYGSTLGAGVNMTFEVTTALSATAHNMTVNSYTDQDGNTAATTGAIAGVSGAIAQRLVPVSLGPFMDLAAGDFGVRSVEQYTNSVALAAGIFALNLVFPLAYIPGIGSNLYIERDSTVQIDGLQQLVEDGGGVIGCLTWFLQTNSTATGIFRAFARTCEG